MANAVKTLHVESALVPLFDKIEFDCRKEIATFQLIQAAFCLLCHRFAQNAK